MEENGDILDYLTDTLDFELGVTDHWDGLHSNGDNDLHDYLQIANSEPRSHQQHDDLHRFSLGEEASSSSGARNEASSSHSEQRRNEIIDLDSDSEQPSPPNQHVQNVNEESGVSIPPVSRNMPPPFQSSNSTVPAERDLHLDETRPRSGIPESPLFIPSPPELRSSGNAASGNLNVASSVSRTGVQPPSYQNLPHQQQRRRSELAAPRSLIPPLAGSGDHPLTAPASPDGIVLQPGGDNSHMPYSRAGLWLDRQGDGVARAPHSFRALAAARRGGRGRLTVSQIQNIMDVMRREPNHTLRLQDVMRLNQSLLFDGAAAGIMHDRYRDMRLDVDNMSYEELLALEERIGDVCTGLNEEAISNRLKQGKFKSSTQDAEPCCICQEEYIEGEDMGTLECSHHFHSQCIKEWLKQKNLCPICKKTGLHTAKKRKIG
ncbi:hypothetical protein HA466_0117260 [Hirschfeldia incana]|nr:hypothetical protein HA466_0117260 [Hirschfeldia incana]